MVVETIISMQELHQVVQEVEAQEKATLREQMLQPIKVQEVEVVELTH